MLSYYGTLLGAVATMLAVVMTIRFTKNQIKRENYLENENEKWARIEASFADILNRLNPIDTIQGVMDTGFVAPDKAINILQKYQMTCNTVTDRLCANLSTADYPKVNSLVDAIRNTSELFFNLCGKQIKQYGLQQRLTQRDSAKRIIDLEAKHPGTLTKEEVSAYQMQVDAAEGIRFDDIKNAINEINDEWAKRYSIDYRNLLKQKGTTFEHIYAEIQQNADEILHLWRES